MKADEAGYISDILIPPTSSNEWTKIANDISLKLSTISPDDAASQGYSRDMGVHVYESNEIFYLLDRCDQRVVDMSWLLAWHAANGAGPKSLQYDRDWIHIETEQDLFRAYPNTRVMEDASAIQMV
jgi:hypothetical protein